MVSSTSSGETDLGCWAATAAPSEVDSEAWEVPEDGEAAQVLAADSEAQVADSEEWVVDLAVDSAADLAADSAVDLAADMVVGSAAVVNTNSWPTKSRLPSSS